MKNIKPITVIKEAFGIKRIIKVGGSHAVILPSDWVDIYTDEVQGSHWVEMGYNNKEITITALTEGDFERISSMIKGVKDDRG